MKHTFNLLQQYHQAFQNPKSRVIVILLTIIYLLSPIDIIPEFLLGPIGFLDDTLLIIMFFAEISALTWKKHNTPNNSSSSTHTSNQSTTNSDNSDNQTTSDSDANM